MQRITSRNARFQVWQALLTNRTKRHRAGEFLVQGVRPITLAADRGWPIRTLIHAADRPPSRWAAELLERHAAVEQVAMAADLLAELGEKTDGPPEVVAVLELPPDDLSRIEVRDDFLGVLFDRPTTPGNIGSIIRSADAFGAGGLIVTGHAADPYDPRSVRASTGSLFALPTVRAPSHREVIAWVRQQDVPIALVGTDEGGAITIDEFNLTQPVLLLVGNETTGLTAAWKELADQLVRIPMTGTASSLNAANAATTFLYEAARQRRSR